MEKINPLYSVSSRTRTTHSLREIHHWKIFSFVLLTAEKSSPTGTRPSIQTLSLLPSSSLLHTHTHSTVPSFHCLILYEQAATVPTLRLHKEHVWSVSLHAGKHRGNQKSGKKKRSSAKHPIIATIPDLSSVLVTICFLQ